MWWLPLPHSCKQIDLSTWSIYSASEVTTLWRYANLFIIIIINISTDTYAQTYGRRLPNWRSVGGPSGDQLCCLLVRLCRDCLLLLAVKAWLVVTYTSYTNLANISTKWKSQDCCIWYSTSLQCRLYLHWGPGHPAAERGPSLENIYRVSLTTDLCEAK